jgi:hypothetical protein
LGITWKTVAQEIGGGRAALQRDARISGWKSGASARRKNFGVEERRFSAAQTLEKDWGFSPGETKRKTQLHKFDNRVIENTTGRW